MAVTGLLSLACLQGWFRCHHRNVRDLVMHNKRLVIECNQAVKYQMIVTSQSDVIGRGSCWTLCKVLARDTTRVQVARLTTIAYVVSQCNHCVHWNAIALRPVITGVQSIPSHLCLHDIHESHSKCSTTRFIEYGRYR